MCTAKHTGRVGALAVALVLMASVVPGPTVSPTVMLAASPEPCTDTDVTCALILGGTTVPTPDSAYIDAVRDHFIAPTHPGQDIDYIPVAAPMELWPFTGAGRLVWLVLGPPSVWGLDGPAWPNEPLWKLSGLFDLSFDQSVRHGVGSLEDEMALHPGQPLVIYGYSQGAIVANLERRKLAEQYPEGTPAPDIDFVLSGDFDTPNGGLAARFPGLYIPIVDFTFNGPAPTDTQFDTVVINREYEGVGDFPLYPLNLLSTVNSLLGVVYVHSRDLEVALPADDPTSSPAYQGSYGHTDYYLFETPDLPLFGPLRTLRVPEPVIDVVEPFFREIVDLGYDRSIKPWEPTPARLIPMHDPAAVAGDLVDAVGEGITNAAALIGAPAQLTSPARAVTAVHDFAEPERPVGREVATARDRLSAAIGTVKSVIGDGRTIVGSGGDNGSEIGTASPARRTPVRDAIKNARGDVKKVVTKVSDSIKKALSGGKDIKDAGGDASR